MANILGDDRKQQILALGRLGWPLRRIEQATRVRAAKQPVRISRRGRGDSGAPAARPPPKPARQVATDSNPASEVSTDLEPVPPGLADLPAWPPPTSRAPTASACAPYREVIELALGRGRNAMAIGQDLVDQHGFPARYASARRFVATLRDRRGPAAHPVIVTAPGEERQIDYGDGPMVRYPGTGKYPTSRRWRARRGPARRDAEGLPRRRHHRPAAHHRRSRDAQAARRPPPRISSKS